jgi:AraC family transcriptional regulator
MLGEHSYGSELRAVEINGIRISETLMPAGLALGEHSHDAGQICFVLEGEYEERIGDRVHDLSAGCIHFHRPSLRHTNKFDDDSDVLALLISIDPHRWIEMSEDRPLTMSGALRDIGDDVRRELEIGDDASRAALEGLALLLLSRVARSTAGIASVEPRWLADAVAMIEHQYHSPIGLSDVADAVGVHRATLAAAFRRFRSTSVGEYLRNLRIHHARQMVLAGVPLDHIASATGFADQAHFGRVFKKMTGMTPGRYGARSFNRDRRNA